MWNRVNGRSRLSVSRETTTHNSINSDRSITFEGEIYIFLGLYIWVLPYSGQAFLAIKGPGGLRDSPPPLMISGTVKASPMKLCKIIVLLKVYQNTKRNIQNMACDVTVTSLLKLWENSDLRNYKSFER